MGNEPAQVACVCSCDISSGQKKSYDILPNLFVSLCSHRPLRGGEKLELPPAMLAGLARESQQRPPPPPHLHPPPPHRAWAQLGQLYDSHLPPQDHPLVPLHSEHSIRLHNGGYTGNAGPSPSPSSHHPHTRPNQVLKVGPAANLLELRTSEAGEMTCCRLLSASVWGSSGATGSQGSAPAGR